MFIFWFKKIIFFNRINIFKFNLIIINKFSLVIMMVDFIIKNRLKGILVISLKKGVTTQWKGWQTLRIGKIYMILSNRGIEVSNRGKFKWRHNENLYGSTLYHIHTGQCRYLQPKRNKGRPTKKHTEKEKATDCIKPWEVNEQ